MKTKLLYLSNFIILFVTLIQGVSNAIATEEWGDIRYVHMTVNIRLGRSTKTQVIAKLVRGDRIRADFLKDNWYAVFKEDEQFREEGNAIGYVYAPLLKTVPPFASKHSPLLKTVPPSSSKQVNSILPYQIVKRNKLDYAGSARMKVKVLLSVSEIPDESSMERLADYLWRKGNKDWDEFTVWIYLPGMDIEKLGFGVVVFHKTGLVYFKKNDIALWETKWDK